MRFVLAFLLLLAAPARAATVPPPDPARFAADIRAFEVADSLAPAPRAAIVFYGSSSICMWHDRLATDFAPLRVVGRGFGGSTMSEAAHYFDRVVVPLLPSTVVIYEGDNDIEMGRTPGEVVRDFVRLSGRLHAKLPRTRLVVLSLKPSPARWVNWPAMRATNARLAALCRRDPARMKFVDLATPLLGSDGQPRPELYLEDRLHLAPACYDAWRGTLFPILVDFVGLEPQSEFRDQVLASPRIQSNLPR